MIYAGFIDTFTRRYGVIVKNWPLSEFKNPSSVGTKTELELLLSAWNTGAAYFYRMPPSEHREWLATYEASLQSPAQGGSESDGDGGVGLGSMVETTERGRASQAKGVGSTSGSCMPAGNTSTAAATSTGHSNFVAMNVVTGANGVAVAMKATTRTRKKRSDAGKPRKKKAQVDGEAA